MKKILRYKKLLILALPILLILLFVGYVFLPLPFPKLVAVQIETPGGTVTPSAPVAANGATPAAGSAGHTSAATNPTEHGPMYEIKDLVVNLAEAGGRRYLKATIVLEFVPKNADFYKLAGEAKIKAQAEFSKEVAGKSPIVQDTLITVLSSKMVNDVFSLEGKTALKTELLTKLNSRLGEDHVDGIYFTQFLIQ